MSLDKTEKARWLANLGGVPRPVHEYYKKFGMPGELVSNRETCKSEFSFISLLFRDHPFRHRWSDNSALNNKYTRYKNDGWVLEILPIS